MKARTGSRSRWLRPISAFVGRFSGDKRGNVAPLLALMIIPLLGIMGMAAEGSYWMFTHRATQNAADSSVVGAANAYEAYSACNASAGTNCTDSAQHEGKSIATKFGFTDGSNNATVAINELIACPPNVSSIFTATTSLGPNSCFTAVVTQKMPLLLLNAFGFGGNTTVNGAKGVLVASTAIAGPVGIQVPVCVLGLSPTGHGHNDTIRLNGAPRADLGACTIFSDGQATCNGGNSGAFIGGAVGVDNGCGVAEFSHQNNVADPYASASSHGTIPPQTCTGSAGVSIGAPGVTTSLTATQFAAALGSASTDSSGMTYGQVCGALTLSGDVQLASGDLGIVIESGDIEFNGHTLSTAGTPGSGTAGMTLIYQGTGTGAFNVTNSNGGTLDISNPTDLTGTSTWNGFTVYDPVDSGSMTYAGNQPAWALTGIVYFPNVDMDWRGIVGKADSGFECFNLVVNTLLIDGTAQMFNPDLNNPSSQCGLDNVKPPTVLGYRYALVG